MNIFWDAEKYKKDFSFVPQYGEAVMDLLDAAPGSRVVDLGCGNGALTEQLAACGYDVTGVDASAEMLELAREGHPELKFLPGNALDFTLDEPVDAVFSNAVLHWIDADKQQAMAGPHCQPDQIWRPAGLRVWRQELRRDGACCTGKAVCRPWAALPPHLLLPYRRRVRAAAGEGRFPCGVCHAV